MIKYKYSNNLVDLDADFEFMLNTNSSNHSNS